MLVEFDKFGMAEKPVLTLAYPQRTELGQLGAYSDLSYDAELRSYSTISFKYPYYCNDGKKSAFYDELCAQMLIKVGGTEKGIGEFIVTACEEESDGAERYKQITANSAEYQLCHRKINLLNGTYKFYDTVNKEETLLGVLIEKYLPTWSIGNVSTDLMGKSRTFDVPDSTLYDFLMNDVSEAYECVFVFDTIKREINVYNIEDSRLIHDSDIYIGYNNFLKSEKVEEISEELVTVMSCYGGDGVNIASVNPLGTVYLYNFDHFKNMMSEGLHEGLYGNKEKGIDGWVKTVNDNKADYGILVEALKVANRELIELKADLKDLESKKSALEDVQAVRIASGQTSATTDKAVVVTFDEDGNIVGAENLTYDVIMKAIAFISTGEGGNVTVVVETTEEEIASIKNTIAGLEVAIDAKEVEIDEIKADKTAINEALKFDKFLTVDEIKELEYFKYESTHQDDNYIITDAMSVDEQHDMIQQLYDSCINIMDKAAHPTYNITADSVNFLFIEKLAPYIDKIYDSSKPETLKQLLGTRFNLEIAEDEWIDPVLLKFHVNFDNPTDFSMEFSNKYRLHNALWTYSDLIGEAVAASGSMSFDYSSVKNWTTHKDEMLDFINGNFDVSKNRLVNNSESNSFLIDNTGIRGSSKNADGTDSKKGIWITADTLAFTDDNWQTVKTALGLIGNTKTYGLNAEMLIGKAILGTNLTISTTADEGASVYMTMDGNGLTVKNNKTLIAINPAEGISVTKNDNTKVFYTDTDGNVVLTGNITATSGEIAGFEITTETKNGATVDVLKSTDSAGNIVLRSDGTAKIGMLTIDKNSATFKGNIYAKNIQYGGDHGTLSGSAITGSSITATQIKGNTITASEIADSTITAGKIGANQISYGSSCVNSASFDTIVAGYVTTTTFDAEIAEIEKLVAKAVTTDSLSAGTLTVKGSIYMDTIKLKQYTMQSTGQLSSNYIVATKELYCDNQGNLYIK